MLIDLFQDLLKKYIKYAKAMKPVLTEEAVASLKDYYTGLRNIYAQQQQ